LEKGLEFSHEVGFLGLVGHTLNHLARVQLRLGDHAAAVDTCERALPHALDSGDKWLHTAVLAAHGMALKASGDLHGALLAFRESLAVAQSFDGLAFAMEALVGLADPVFHGGHFERSVTLLSCVIAAPRTTTFVAAEAAELVGEYGDSMNPGALDAARETGSAMSLQEAFALAGEARLVGPGLVGPSVGRRVGRRDSGTQPN